MPRIAVTSWSERFSTVTVIARVGAARSPPSTRSFVTCTIAGRSWPAATARIADHRRPVELEG